MKLTCKLFDALIQHTYAVSVSIPVGIHWKDVNEWCHKIFGNNFTSSTSAFYFKTDADRNWFVLKWS